MRELKRYKEELLVIVVVFIALLAVRWLGVNYFSTGRPDDLPNQYDLRSEVETIVWVFLRLVIYTLMSWGALRVIMPDGYNWLKHGIVDGFKGLNAEQKTTMSTRFWAILFFGTVLLALSGCAAHAADTRTCVVASASYDVGVREATGHNDGPEVERYLKHVGLGKGHAWCAAFVCYHLSECGVKNPRSAWSPSVASGGQRVWSPRKAVRDPLPGDVFALYYPALKRVGHVGFVSAFKRRYIDTVEGNTSGPGSREGDGVYARRRELSKVHSIINYISDETPSARTTGALRSTRLQGQAQPGERKLGARQHGDHRDSARHDLDRTALGGYRGGALARSWKERACNETHLREVDHNGEGPGRSSGRELRLRYRAHRGHASRQAHAQHAHRGQGGEVRGGALPYTLVAGGRGHQWSHRSDPSPTALAA